MDLVLENQQQLTLDLPVSKLQVIDATDDFTERDESMRKYSQLRSEAILRKVEKEQKELKQPVNLKVKTRDLASIAILLGVAILIYAWVAR